MQKPGKKFALVAYSKAGAELALKLREEAKAEITAGKLLAEANRNSQQNRQRELAFALAEAVVYGPARIAEEFCKETGLHEHEKDVIGFDNASDLMGALAKRCDCIVCFGATGIVVRSMAPHLENKYADPAVLVCDEAGKHVISLLSGHVGGANDYAKALAERLGGEAVITTASDTAGRFAVDSWAEEQKLYLAERKTVKEITAQLLEGKPVGFCSEVPVEGELPGGLVLCKGDENPMPSYGMYVSETVENNPFEHTLHLLPKNLVVGIGCKRGTEPEQIEEAWQDVCRKFQLMPERIRTIASVDRKLDEEGLLQWGRSRKAELLFFTAEELAEAKGDFASSEFVESVIGVDNVCQRAAAKAAEVISPKNCNCVVPKQKYSGVTVAVYCMEPEPVRFGK